MAYMMKLLLLAPVYLAENILVFNFNKLKQQKWSDFIFACEITLQPPCDEEESQAVDSATRGQAVDSATRSHAVASATRGHAVSSDTRHQAISSATRHQTVSSATTQQAVSSPTIHQTVSPAKRHQAVSSATTHQAVSSTTHQAVSSTTHQAVSSATRHQVVNHASRTAKFDLLSSLPSNLDKTYLNFPFLTDRETFKYINNKDTKVMFIMRGLSGSGKSCIVNIIRSSFKHVLVCSADEYFYTENGEYEYDKDFIKTAHEDCQEKAKQACNREISIVVIDNTHIRKWELKYYIELARTSCYFVVLVQPKTPWSWDAYELADKNRHATTVEVLQKKIVMFDDIIPAYYGWFLNEKQSKYLTSLYSDIFLECASKFPKLQQDLLNKFQIKLENIDAETATRILSEYYSRENIKSPLLHCTAKYCAWGKAPDVKDYHKRPDVQQACGQMFLLTITGLVITKNTVGARVTLDSSARGYFCNSEEQDWSNQRLKHSRGSQTFRRGQVEKTLNQDEMDQFVKKSNRKVKKNPLKFLKKQNKKQKKSSEKHEIVCVDSAMNENGRTYERLEDDDNLSETDSSMVSHTQKEDESIISLSHKFPTLNFSNTTRSAHFTIKTAKGVMSHEVNHDILHACEIEASRVYTQSDFVQVSLGHTCYYGDGLCCVYFDRPLLVKTLFSGYY